MNIKNNECNMRSIKKIALNLNKMLFQGNQLGKTLCDTFFVFPVHFKIHLMEDPPLL